MNVPTIGWCEKHSMKPGETRSGTVTLVSPLTCSFCEIDRLRVENEQAHLRIVAGEAKVVELTMENGRLRSALERVSEGGAIGFSECGCTWCLTADEHTKEEFRRITRGGHMATCPVGFALGSLAQSEGEKP